MGHSYTSNIASADFDGCMMGSHLTDWDSINGMPYFPTGTKSLLYKCLTKDVWEACKDRRDKYGFTFR